MRWVVNLNNVRNFWSLPLEVSGSCICCWSRMVSWVQLKLFAKECFVVLFNIYCSSYMKHKHLNGNLEYLQDDFEFSRVVVLHKSFPTSVLNVWYCLSLYLELSEFVFVSKKLIFLPWNGDIDCVDFKSNWLQNVRKLGRENTLFYLYPHNVVFSLSKAIAVK